MKIRTEVTIAAAHFVHTTDTPCKRLHGHNWRIKVEIEGNTKDDGMVVDFIEIKKIINQLDHKFLIPNMVCCEVKNDFATITDELENLICIVPMDWIILTEMPVITAEWMAIMIRDTISKDQHIPPHKISIKVWESDKSWAEA